MEMELLTSSMLSAAIKSQYISMLPLLHHCLPVFDETCATAMDLDLVRFSKNGRITDLPELEPKRGKTIICNTLYTILIVLGVPLDPSLVDHFT